MRAKYGTVHFVENDRYRICKRIAPGFTPYIVACALSARLTVVPAAARLGLGDFGDVAGAICRRHLGIPLDTKAAVLEVEGAPGMSDFGQLGGVVPGVDPIRVVYVFRLVPLGTK